MSGRFFIATTLSPRDERGVQSTAIDSWLAHGCTVLSVNSEDKIQSLKQDYPDVEFVAAERTAERFAGRPVPFVYDLIQAAKDAASESDTIGVTSADIILRPLEGLMPFAAKAAENSVVLGPRVDVPDQDSINNFTPDTDPVFSVGYDFFLMSRNVANDFEDSPFAMGMPFWDYWLPLTAFLAGRPLKTLKSPVALHVAHEIRWDDTIYLFFHALIAYVLEQGRKNLETDTSKHRQLSFFLDVVSHTYGHIFENGTAGSDSQPPDEAGLSALSDFYDRFQEIAVHTIKSNSDAIHFERQ